MTGTAGTNKVSKASVDYSPAKTPKGEHCGNCGHFNSVLLGFGECNRVKGIIEQSMWCKLWIP